VVPDFPDNPYKVNRGVKRVWLATVYSWEGLIAAVRLESAFRQELALALLMLPCAWWLGRNWTEIVLLVITVVLVLIVELMNSAVEAVVDRVSYERHPLSKLAKDFGSAAVHLSLLLCGGVWASLLYVRLWA